MGVSVIIAKFLGKTLGGALKVPVKDGVMFPYNWTYLEKIKDIGEEQYKVNRDYLNGLIEAAYRKHDFDGLAAIYHYMERMGWRDGLFQKVLRYGQDLKLRETIGDPFALVESVVRHLC